MKQLPHTHWCFACGESNPVGFNMRSETDGKVVQTRFSFRDGHIGYKQTVHGGLTATLLDEIMTWACAVGTKRFAFCAELNVRYLQPVRPHQPLVATARLLEDRRGRLFVAAAELLDEQGTVLASATGKYLPLKDATAAEMSSDFIGTLDWVLSSDRLTQRDTIGRV